MEEVENSKTWFILHDGERFGPYSIDDLKQGVEFHEINPRLDMAWQEGMEDWIPAGEIEGLFVKNEHAQSGEKKAQKESKKKIEEKDTKSAFSESEFEDEDDPSNYSDGQEWEGVSRGGFFFFCFIFPVLWWVGGFYGLTMLGGVISGDLMAIVMACLALLPFFIIIFAILKRFQNLAMSRLWFFGLGAPFLQIWLYYRLFACPPGYAEHKRLGALGWFLAIIYWLPCIAIIGLASLVMIQGPDKYKDEIEKSRPKYEEFILKVKELTQTPEEAKAKEEEQKAKEKAAKGPSIIPIRK